MAQLCPENNFTATLPSLDLTLFSISTRTKPPFSFQIALSWGENPLWHQSISRASKALIPMQTIWVCHKSTELIKMRLATSNLWLVLELDHGCRTWWKSVLPTLTPTEILLACQMSMVSDHGCRTWHLIPTPTETFKVFQLTMVLDHGCRTSVSPRLTISPLDQVLMFQPQEPQWLKQHPSTVPLPKETSRLTQLVTTPLVTLPEALWQLQKVSSTRRKASWMTTLTTSSSLWSEHA